MNSFAFSLFIFCSVVWIYAEGKCENEPDGSFLADPTSRSRYFYCWGGREITNTCPRGEEFNPFDRVCLPGGGIQNPPVQVPRDLCAGRADNTFLADPSSRQRYLFCMGGRSFPGYCGEGEVFVQRGEYCEIDPNFVTTTTRRTAAPAAPIRSVPTVTVTRRTIPTTTSRVLPSRPTPTTSTTAKRAQITRSVPQRI